MARPALTSEASVGEWRLLRPVTGGGVGLGHGGMGAGWSEAAGRGGAGRGGGRGLACVSERSSDPYLGGRGLSCLRLGSRQGNHEYGDVIARSQPVVGQTPPPLLQNPP